MDNKPGIKALKQDIFLGLFIALFGTVALISTFKFPEGAALMPRVVTILLLALGLLLSAAGLIKLKKGSIPEHTPIELARMKYPAIAYLLILVYAALINILGFYSATLLFLVCFMYFMNIRKPRTIILTAVILLGFVYLLFNVGLSVNFPSGILI